MPIPTTPRPLSGSIPPFVTPFRNGAIDERQYATLVEFQIAQGSHGLLVNGTRAEPSTLTVAERNRLIDVAIEAAVGRLTIVTPYYVRLPQRGLIAFYLEAIAGMDVPWLLEINEHHLPMAPATPELEGRLDAVPERAQLLTPAAS
jgi:4-hydroxy-tetrahydrodipicolinate synthase